jgi:hypothetical protein
MRTWSEALRYVGDPDAPDTTPHLSDAQIAVALAVEHTALGAAAVLSERHGRIVAAHDVRRRIRASPALQRIQALAQQQHMQGAIASCRIGIERQLVDRQRKLQEWRRLHDERVHLCELRRARNQSRCGAKTRTGKPCERRPELGRSRCRNHGGCSTGPRTEQGRARALAALERGRRRVALRSEPLGPRAKA